MNDTKWKTGLSRGALETAYARLGRNSGVGGVRWVGVV